MSNPDEAGSPAARGAAAGGRPRLWIVDRDAQRRAALARLAGAASDAVLGAPGDLRFDSAPPADVVVLGLTGDLEAELQFAHRSARRLRRAGWILLPERRDAGEVRRLFDAIDAEVLAYPPDARTLRWRIRSAPWRAGAGPLPLTQRAARDALAGRFARWFADVELPELLRALDPRRADTPILVRGETGTGRGVLIRYLHAFGGTGAGVLIRVPCSRRTSAADLRSALAARARTRRARAACCIWLEDADALAPEIQRELRDWIERAAPEGLLQSRLVRWVASAADPADASPAGPHLEPSLVRSLSALTLRIPPLRERPERVAAVARETALAWCQERELRPRQLDPAAIAALEAYPWPGNLAELEAVVVQSLSASDADPLCADDLRCAGEPFLPAAAGEAAAGAPAGLEETHEGVIPVEQVLLPEPAAEAVAPAAGLPGPGLPATLPRLAGAVAHAVRNPLASIQTFAQLLPARFEDAEFRSRFSAVVRDDVARIGRAVEHLERLGSLETPSREPVDVAGLLDRLLEGRRDEIRRRHLVVLKELDQDQPLALGDPEQLRAAFDALLEEVLALASERGDVYFGSRHHDAGLPTGASLRVLARCRESSAAREPALAAVSAASVSLPLAIAEAIVRAHGGAFAIDAAGSGETLIVLDLPAPGLGVPARA